MLSILFSYFLKKLLISYKHFFILIARFLIPLLLPSDIVNNTCSAFVNISMPKSSLPFPSIFATLFKQLINVINLSQSVLYFLSLINILPLICVLASYCVSSFSKLIPSTIYLRLCRSTSINSLIYFSSYNVHFLSKSVKAFFNSYLSSFKLS